MLYINIQTIHDNRGPIEDSGHGTCGYKSSLRYKDCFKARTETKTAILQPLHLAMCFILVLLFLFYS